METPTNITSRNFLSETSVQFPASESAKKTHPFTYFGMSSTINVHYINWWSRLAHPHAVSAHTQS